MHRLSHERFDGMVPPRIREYKGRFFSYDQILDVTLLHAIQITEMMYARQRFY